MRKGLNEKSPNQENPLRKKLTKATAVGAATLTVVAGAAYGFNRNNAEIELEKLTASTSIDKGESKMTKEIPLDDIEVMGYTVEYTGIRVSRDIDSKIDLNKLNPFGDETNKLIATVDVNTESILKIDSNKLSSIDVDIDEENKTIYVEELSKGVLSVQSREEPGSLRYDPDQEGLNARIKGAHDGAFNDGEYLEEDRNEVLNLATYVALHQSDNRAEEAVTNNLPMLEQRLEEVIIEDLDLKDQGYKVEIDWAEDGQKPTVIDKEKNEAAITNLGGEEILDEGSVSIPDDTGGKA